MPDRPMLPPKSTFADDPEMRELVDTFVGELPARIDALRQALVSRDASKVRLMAHQLKGAAAGYGFPSIGRAAACIDEVLRGQAKPEMLDTVKASMEELLSLCDRASRSNS